jgi:uncharacterized repeat protein (TIGR03847 family)
VNASFDLPEVDRITVGTVGAPGERTFFLQARGSRQLVTLKMEKQQVAALAQYLADQLGNLPAVGDLPGDLELEAPIEPDWAVGGLEISYDEASDRIVLIAHERVAEEDEEAAAVARLTVSREQVAALAIRGTALVEAGRPPCPLCSYPLDPSGHVCPRTNGHRPPKL